MNPQNCFVAIFFAILTFFLGIFPSASHAVAADLVESLGLNDASSLDQLKVLYESKLPRQTPEANAEKASTIRTLLGGVVGENRLLFEVKFDEPPVMERSGFCLYLDLDNDPKTGRSDEGARGVDLMVAFDEANKVPYLQFRNSDLNASSTKMRAVWDGPCLYITVETPLPNHPAAIRAYFLSGKDKGVSVTSTPKETLMEVNPSEIILPNLH